MWQHHDADALNGSNLYRAGRRYPLIGSYAFAAGSRASAIVYGGGVHRDRGRSELDLALDAPAQDLVIAGGGMRIPLGAATLAPSVDARFGHVVVREGEESGIAGFDFGLMLRSSGSR